MHSRTDPNLRLHRPTLLSTLVLAALVLTALPLSAADFSASFVDPAWDGQKVPEGEQCKRFGGAGQTPELQVEGIPEGANALVLEFNDTTYQPMNDGGHGKIGYSLEPGTTSVTVPRAPGHQSELEAPFFVVAEHRAPTWDQPGAYLPPCSGGRGNHYTLTLKAVHRMGEEIHELATVTLDLGTY